jgi:hypothetical protein
MQLRQRSGKTEKSLKIKRAVSSIAALIHGSFLQLSNGITVKATLYFPGQPTMNKPAMTLLLIVVLALVAFATWQLFAGNLTASFSTFPILLITYLFVLKLQRRED